MSSNGELELEWWAQGTVPAPASLVWCYFPEHLDLGKPGPKSRPGLVLKVRYRGEPADGRFLVQVAYGTTKLKTGKRPLDFVIANSATLDIVRLPSATRFDLDTVLWLPWAREFFDSRPPGAPHCTPVISVLPQSVQEQLAWTMQARDKVGLNAALKQPPQPEAPAAEDA